MSHIKRLLFLTVIISTFFVTGAEANEREPIKLNVHTFELSSNSEHQMKTECEEGGLPNTCCSYWNVSVSWTFTGPEYTCETGGDFQCESDEECSEVGVN